jgi:hypothetical protein
MKTQNTQHTPGPWKTFGDERVLDEMGSVICNMTGQYSKLAFNNMANARLIREAPNMFEALEKLAKLGNGDKYGNSEGNLIARAALKQAKGE